MKGYLKSLLTTTVNSKNFKINKGSRTSRISSEWIHEPLERKRYAILKISCKYPEIKRYSPNSS